MNGKKPVLGFQDYKDLRRPVRRTKVNGSHHIFKMPWPGDPRLNLQSDRGKAKPYQVEQVITALKKLDEMSR